MEGGSRAVPEMRLARLRDLRHPMSVDLWIEKVARHARVILVRLLGGYDWWGYGCDRLAAVARERGIALALLPGECREDDARLAALSTVPEAELAALLACFREGGPENMRVAGRGGWRGLPGATLPVPTRAAAAGRLLRSGDGCDLERDAHPPPCGEGRRQASGWG